MSNNRLQMDGLDEFRQQLRNLPESLEAEADAIVIAHAEDAGGRIETAYGRHRRSGNLEDGVIVRRDNPRFGVRALVRSRAPHAWMFENGTRQRRTQAGANRGAMPAAPQSDQMIPIVIQVRRRMVTALIHMLQRAGLEVTAS